MSNEIRQRLEEVGIKSSVPRVKILEHLMTHNTHPSADALYKELQEEVPGISKATVYNTLNLFSSKGLVNPVSVEATVMHYDGMMHKHGHFVCKKCGEIYDFSYKQEDRSPDLEGFDVQNVEIMLRGICKKCKE